MCFFFFKQKTAYEMRISDWSSDVCSSDLRGLGDGETPDDATWQALRQGDAPVLVEYTITEEDAATDFAKVPSDMMAKARAEERRVGKECDSTCRSRWSP